MINRVVPDVLEMVGLSGKANRLPAELSGGEQQRVAIARAFVNRPLVLLADEPTGNLDPETSKDIMDLLERINRTGTTVLMATHDHHIVDSMRQRVVELEPGPARPRRAARHLRNGSLVRFGFLLNEVWTGLRRNVTMTVAMILTTAISIGLFGGGLLVVRLADHSRAIYLDRVESQVFLTNDVSANDPTCDADPCKALRQQIEDRDDVRSVRFLNRDDAYNDAIKKFPQYKDVAGKDAFPASFVVKLDDPEQHKDFDDAMAGQPGVLNVLNQKDLIDRLFAVLDGLSNAAFAVALVQAIGAVLLIANMVQVAAYTRRTEIGIMRLVGASRWYTQLPFLVEAMLAALIGVVIAIIGLIVVRALFLENALNQFYQANLIARVDYADILYIAPMLLFVGVAMAGVTAYATLRLYVRR